MLAIPQNFIIHVGYPSELRTYSEYIVDVGYPSELIDLGYPSELIAQWRHWLSLRIHKNTLYMSGIPQNTL